MPTSILDTIFSNSLRKQRLDLCIRDTSRSHCENPQVPVLRAGPLFQVDEFHLYGTALPPTASTYPRLHPRLKTLDLVMQISYFNYMNTYLKGRNIKILLLGASLFLGFLLMGPPAYAQEFDCGEPKWITVICCALKIEILNCALGYQPCRLLAGQRDCCGTICGEASQQARCGNFDAPSGEGGISDNLLEPGTRLRLAYVSTCSGDSHIVALGLRESLSISLDN